MPGSSLWLIPPTNTHPFNKSLTKLITETVPSNFPTLKCPKFIGHVTVTSDVDPAKTYKSHEQAQQWLDGLKLPERLRKEHDEAVVEVMELEAGDSFFKKLTLRARKDANLVTFAAAVRAQALQVDETTAEKWAQNDYLPHLSLLYADAPKHDIEQKMHRVELQLGFEFGDLFACCGGMLAQGARLVLVDTQAEGGVEEWKVLAERSLDWVVWRAARALV